MLPETYESLDVSARILPDNSDTVCAPFIGLVINLNVATAAHQEKRFCAPKSRQKSQHFTTSLDSVWLHLDSVWVSLSS